MPSTDQACVPIPVSIDRASRAGGRSRCRAARSVTNGGTDRSILALASPAPVLALQKYDNRIVHCGAPRASRRPNYKYDEEPPARASRLTADDRHRHATLLLGMLTPMFPQNNSGTDGLGCHQVNFSSAAISREHLLIRPGVHTSSRGVARRWISWSMVISAWTGLLQCRRSPGGTGPPRQPRAFRNSVVRRVHDAHWRSRKE